ncbi:MAG: hypothetical protein JWR24_5405 [Actinoallomurus sp.]|nr:hypothetical protein [Actinoallomurus sp.]
MTGALAPKTIIEPRAGARWSVSRGAVGASCPEAV